MPGFRINQINGYISNTLYIDQRSYASTDNYQPTSKEIDGTHTEVSSHYRAPRPTMMELPYITPQEFDSRELNTISETPEQSKNENIYDDVKNMIISSIKESESGIFKSIQKNEAEISDNLKNVIYSSIEECESDVMETLIDKIKNVDTDMKEMIEDKLKNVESNVKNSLDDIVKKMKLDMTTHNTESLKSMKDLMNEFEKKMNEKLINSIKIYILDSIKDAIGKIPSAPLSPASKPQSDQIVHLKSELSILIGDMDRRIKSIEDRVKVNTKLIDERTDALMGEIRSPKKI